VYAVTAASFMGYTGFTLSMPFLPLYIRQLGVTDVGEISIWTGVSLAITPAQIGLVSAFCAAVGGFVIRANVYAPVDKDGNPVEVVPKG